MFRITNGLIIVSSLIRLFSNVASSTLTSSDFNKYLSHNGSYNINNNEHKDLKDDTINFNVIDPSPPFNLYATDITATSFQLHWELPFAKVDGFLIQIIELGFNYYIPPLSCIFPTKQPREICLNDHHTTRYTIDGILPNQNIKVRMASYYETSGPWSIPITIKTLPKESDSVTNIDVKFSEDKGLVIWKQPCFSNGNIVQFNLIAKGEHVKKAPIFTTDLIKKTLPVAQMQDEYKLEINLKAEYFYELSIQTFIKEIDNGSAYGVYKFTSPSQIPPEPSKSLKLAPESKSSSIASIQLFAFKDSNGEILCYSVMIGETGYISSTSGWINTTTDWPLEKTWQQVNQENQIEEYQVTNKGWNPFKGQNQDARPKFSIGNDSDCRSIKNDSIYCNGPLRPNTEYGVILRAFTSRGYRDSQVFYFTTARLGNAYFIILTMAIVAAIGSVVAFSYMLVIKRRKKWQMQRKRQNKLNIDLGITSDIENSTEPENLQLLNIDAINEEYEKLKKNSKKIHHHITVGSDRCNKDKNRYCNILPYDYNRVTLCGSDSGYYINASHIYGLGGVNNFIATQGPKENTAVDFWKMVASHNITIIIMLCKTVEQKKVKCDVYYPEAGMNIMYGDLCVYCIQRQPNKSYIVRDLILVKDGQKLYISHFQYLEWPDFGAPSSVKTFMKFCNLITKVEDPSNNSNPLAVHCSAGCGRTGTFIAIYHMLKMKPADVDIYEIVYKLRDKKMGMVQTREQYIFLYKCLIYLKKTRTN